MPVAPLASEPAFSWGDPWAIALLFLAGAIFAAIGALSHQHERAFSASLIYLGLGLGAAGVIGVVDVDWLDPLREPAVVEHLTEFAVLVACFSTGLRLDRVERPRVWTPVVLLLVVAMPLTIAGVVLWGVAAMGLSLGAAVILGGILAPTDPVLAGDVGVGPPGEDEHRQSRPEFVLSAEAAANDGLATPFVFLGLLIAEGANDLVATWVLADVLYAIGVAAVVGALGGYGIAALFVRLRDAELLEHELDGWAGIATALALYAAAETLGAYGFLAAFVGGIAFRRYEYEHAYNRRVHDGAEMVEKFLELAVVLLLGSLVTVAGLRAPGLTGWLLVPVLILLIRPLSILVCAPGLGLRAREAGFLAWFGVKGVCSLNYSAIVVGSGALAAREESLVVWTVVACVISSIVVHGISATPMTARLLAGTRS
jgi:NhaP-type Na+/H+ or K+/H+ antiporter